MDQYQSENLLPAASNANAAAISTPNRSWKRAPRIANPLWRWLLIIGCLGYLIIAINSLDINWARISEGLERGWRFFSAFLQPDFISRGGDIFAGFIESLTMTITSTAAGVVLALPLAIGAARNLASGPVYFFCRSIIAMSRALNEIIIAIFAVAMFGFGPFAGFITLTFATMGFMAKLLAEEIEEIKPVTIEAITATGSNKPQLLSFAVLPAVLPRLVGLSMYRLDINLRESAVIGIVGAGGIGGTLATAMDRYEFNSAAAIILVIIGLVMLAEYFSGWIRKWMQ